MTTTNDPYCGLTPLAESAIPESVWCEGYDFFGPLPSGKHWLMLTPWHLPTRTRRWVVIDWNDEGEWGHDGNGFPTPEAALRAVGLKPKLLDALRGEDPSAAADDDRGSGAERSTEYSAGYKAGLERAWSAIRRAHSDAMRDATKAPVGGWQYGRTSGLHQAAVILEVEMEAEPDTITVSDPHGELDGVKGPVEATINGERYTLHQIRSDGDRIVYSTQPGNLTPEQLAEAIDEFDKLSHDLDPAAGGARTPNCRCIAPSIRAIGPGWIETDNVLWGIAAGVFINKGDGNNPCIQPISYVPCKLTDVPFSELRAAIVAAINWRGEGEA